MRLKCYSELQWLKTFEDRFDYLNLRGVVGETTFGFDRWVNQQFYHSREWYLARSHVIARDIGCDLGIPGYEIHTGLMVHHMNPIGMEEIAHGDPVIFDPEYLILTSLTTHNAIHYGNKDLLPRGPIERKSGDTTLW